MRISSKALNLVANACLVLAAGTLGVAVWYKYLHHPAVPVSGLPIQLGSNAPLVPSISYASHERSLLVFLSTTCRYCEAGVPFYNKLHGVALASNDKWNVVGVFLQPADQVAAFRARVNLQAKLLPNVDFSRFGVRSTPTVLLVDRQGIVRQVWVGASRANESAILATLESSHVD
jgi:peroxiredoxin